jgi:hypothetical protein
MVVSVRPLLMTAQALPPPEPRGAPPTGPMASGREDDLRIDARGEAVRAPDAAGLWEHAGCRHLHLGAHPKAIAAAKRGQLAWRQ